MLQYEELKIEIEPYSAELTKLSAALNLSKLEKDIAELETLSAAPDFWNDTAKSQQVLRKIGDMKHTCSGFRNLETEYEYVLTMIELGGS